MLDTFLRWLNFDFLLSIIICFLLLEFTEFPMLIRNISFKEAPEANRYAKPQFLDDWFDNSTWPTHHCPYFEDVCIYNQRFYVSRKEDKFHLKEDLNTGSMFGSQMPNHESVPMYKNIFNATTWNEAENEYKLAQCRYDDVANHMIVQGHYQTMLGEWYSRSLTEIYKLYINNNVTTDEEIKMYLFIGDQVPLFTSHHLFAQPFSNYNILHFTDLIERIDCHCLKRLILCGFKRNMETNELHPLSRVRERMESKGLIIPYYKGMIDFYNSYVDRVDMHIERDVKLWKRNRLKTYLLNNTLNGFNETEPINVDEWFFIGFYQRNYRRTWLQLEKLILPACNEKYSGRKIFCDSVNLEGHLHPRDVVIMHRSFDMLIGIHGAHLTDAIWMKDAKDPKRNRYVIELLPVNGLPWTASLESPTALGVIFWGSRLNHVGLKLLNTSITEKEWKRNKRWYSCDFKVNWNRLGDVIDYLIIDDGGYCKRYKNARDIKIPSSFIEKGHAESFSIYNAFCAENDKNESDVWHFTGPWGGRRAKKCETCTKPVYEL